MPQIIKIKKGLDIPIEGHATESIIGNVKSKFIKIYPSDFPGLTPKVSVKVGDKVKAGTPIMYDKNNPEVVFVSPTSGEITAVTRAEKRRLLNIEITVEDQDIVNEIFDRKSPLKLSGDEVKDKILEGGLWPFIKQRPYDIIADPNSDPRDIFVTAFSSAPLSPSYDFIIDRSPEDFQTGLDALSKLTNGKVYLGIGSQTQSNTIRNAQNVDIYEFQGPHPAGNVGIQINNIKPVNKGETVWTLDALDILFIGHLFNKGYVDFTRLIAYTGSEAIKKGYYNMTLGSCVSSLTTANTTKGKNLRFISGNVLTGTKINSEGHLRFYDSQITVIPEGNDTYEMLGWAMPGLQKYSAGATFFSRLMKNKKFKFDSRLLGGRRAIIMSNEYEKVFPMDIMPEFLIKATIAFNIEKMEQLGIYEVAPEDFALCEFVDTSKLEIQYIIRQGLLQLKKGME